MAKVIKNNQLKILYNQMYRCNNCLNLKKMECNIYDKGSNGPLKGGGCPTNCAVMFVGQNPSYRRFEDTNCAFAGGLGEKFREILDEIGINKRIFVTNVVKCSTPNNREPTENELKRCAYYIESEIKIIKPKVIVPMGKFAKMYFDRHKEDYESKIMPIYHPNYVLSYRRDKMDDFKRMLRKIKKYAYEE